jgi:hypothetical protein
MTRPLAVGTGRGVARARRVNLVVIPAFHVLVVVHQNAIVAAILGTYFRIRSMHHVSGIADRAGHGILLLFDVSYPATELIEDAVFVARRLAFAQVVFGPL